MNVAALHHSHFTCALFLMLLALLGPCAWSAPTPPAPANAAGTATNHRIIERGPNGELLGVRQNPEALMPLNDKASGAPGSQVPQYSLVSILNQILMLGLILILAYLAILAWKKFNGLRFNLPGLPGVSRAVRAIHILESASLGQGRGVHLILVGGRCLLVGSAMQQVSLLSDLTDDPEIRRMLSQEPSPDAASLFQQQLSRLYSPQGGKEPR